ncbi:N-acetylglucosamine kinase [Planotetraspora sp. GP83]|uniref:N-acetylglucosamine kinase n=1 Tax=Planotetraspora sp. GP83 TaxID=3156264 RepID=UPI0035144480
MKVAEGGTARTSELVGGTAMGGLIPGAVLAIDAGNSKTEVALVSAAGEVLSWVRGGGFQPHGPLLGHAIDLIEDLVMRATGGRAAEYVSAYLAHCDLPVERRRLCAAISVRRWGRGLTVDNDTFAILRAGSPMPYGVAVVCGGGMNCVAVSPDGRTARYLALGRLSGDWGGGEFLGEEVLWHAVRGEDGRGTRTGLQEATTAHFGLPSVEAVCVAIHRGELDGARLHELAPLLFRVADAGDPVAGGLVERLGVEVATMAAAAVRRLDFQGRRIPLVLGGGVLRVGHPELMAHTVRALAETGLDADVRILAEPPIAGAALHGMDVLGHGPAAERRLRAALANGSPADV